MRLRIVAVLCVLCFWSDRLLAQPASLQSVRELWHNAGKHEVLGDFLSASKGFEDVIIAAQDLSPDIREWYSATCFFALARCEAKLSHPSNSRNALVSAFANHFCNYGLVRLDSSLLACVGREWYDSVEKVWFDIMSVQSKDWKTLLPVVLVPSQIQNGKPRPLLVWLHGGNGNNRRSAEIWKSVSDSLNLIMIFPPGTIRLSDITNSWDTDISVVDKAILPIVDTLVRTGLVDTNEIYVGGFSQGAQAALQLPIVSKLHFRGAVIFSGFLLTEMPSSDLLAQAARRNVRIHATSGTLDAKEFLSSLHTAQNVYRNSGVDFKFDIVEDMIHETPLDLDERFPKIWEWLHEKNK
jgi:predicted esterase